MNEIRTYQTRLDLSIEQAALLDAYAALYGKAERSLFAGLCAGESPSVREGTARFGIIRSYSGLSCPGATGRQHRSLGPGIATSTLACLIPYPWCCTKSNREEQ